MPDPLALLTPTDPTLAAEGIERALQDPDLCTQALAQSAIGRHGHVHPGPPFRRDALHVGTVLTLAARAPAGTRPPPSLERDAVLWLDLRLLRGHIPDAIGRFTRLQWLDLSDNDLDRLPDWLSRLSSLHGLVARGNRLRAVPALPASLSVLDVSSNRLDALPTRPSGLSALIADNNRIDRIPAGLSCGHLSLVANPLPPQAAPDGVESLEQGTDPRFITYGPRHTPMVWLGTQTPTPPVERVEISCGPHTLVLLWDDGENRWFAEGSPAHARSALSTVASEGASSRLMPGGVRSWSPATAQAVGVQIAAQGLAARSLVPLARSLLSRARADLGAPLPPGERARWRAVARRTEAALLHRLFARQGSWLLAACGPPPTGDHRVHPDAGAAIWKEVDDGWSRLGRLFSRDPCAEIQEQIGATAHAEAASQPYLIADLSTALLAVWPYTTIHTAR